MPACLIDEERGMGSRRDLGGDFGQVQVHRLGVAPRHNERRTLSLSGTDRAEDIGRGGSLIFRRAGARSAFSPTAGDLVLLADPNLVDEPDLCCAGIDALFSPDLFQTRGEIFSKSSIAPSTWA